MWRCSYNAVTRDMTIADDAYVRSWLSALPSPIFLNTKTPIHRILSILKYEFNLCTSCCRCVEQSPLMSDAGACDIEECRPNPQLSLQSPCLTRFPSSSGLLLMTRLRGEGFGTKGIRYKEGQGRQQEVLEMLAVQIKWLLQRRRLPPRLTCISSRNLVMLVD